MELEVTPVIYESGAELEPCPCLPIVLSIIAFIVTLRYIGRSITCQVSAMVL